MRSPITIGAGLAAALALGACQDQPTAPSARTIAPDAPARSVGASAPSPSVASATFGRANTADVMRPAINPGDYVCSDRSPVMSWWLGTAIDFIRREPAIFSVVYTELYGGTIALDEPGLFETTATPQTFGFTGQFTKTIGKSERDVKGFWDVDARGIQIIAAHGRVLTDVAKVAATYQADYGMAAGVATQLAQTMRSTVLASQVLNGGDHPLFTFNAYAAWDIAPGVPDKIVVGDAVLEGYQALGLGDVAPQAIVAHEFAHHIQHLRGYFHDAAASGGSAAERTRYTELMADAYAGYFLTHKRGGAMNRKRVEEFLDVFFELGDCAFADAGHHGTPSQRLKASRVGFSIADDAQRQGQILSVEQFHALFVAQYPAIVAPDAI